MANRLPAIWSRDGADWPIAVQITILLCARCISYNVTSELTGSPVIDLTDHLDTSNRRNITRSVVPFQKAEIDENFGEMQQ